MVRARQHTHRHSAHRSSWRFLMAGVLLAHLPATLHAFSALWDGGHAGSSLSSLLLLSASNLFFLCEILFATSLRLLNDRRSAVAFLLIVALLHVGVLERSGLFPALHDDLRVCLAVIAVGALALHALLRLLAGRCVIAGRAAEQRSAGPFPGRRSPPRVVPRRSMCTWLSVPHRAPPVLS